MPIFLPILIFLLGLSTGSFLSVLIPRLKAEQPGIIKGRSTCPACHTRLKPLDLIPLLSFIFLKGKCRYCHKPIPAVYPLIELTCGILFLLTLKILFPQLLYLPPAELLNSYSALLLLYLFYLTVLVFIFFYDLLYLEISDKVLIPAIVIALLASFIPTPYLPNPFSALIGAAIPTALFAAQILISKGKWLGGGDLRIGAFIGLILGTERTILALILTYLIGAGVAVYLLAAKKAKKETAVPFGPFLVAGTIISLFYGHTIINWYLYKLLPSL